MNSMDIDVDGSINAPRKLEKKYGTFSSFVCFCEERCYFFNGSMLFFRVFRLLRRRRWVFCCCCYCKSFWLSSILLTLTIFCCLLVIVYYFIVLKSCTLWLKIDDRRFNWLLFLSSLVNASATIILSVARQVSISLSLSIHFIIGATRDRKKRHRKTSKRKIHHAWKTN